MLRLDAKVAAETRRLAALGDPTPRGVIVLAFLLAAAVHAALLALPLPARFAPVAEAAGRPDLPYVWRWGPAPPAPPPAAAVAGRSSGRAARASAVPAVAPEAYEPVPEPVPNVAATVIPAEIEALIPAPDAQLPASGDDDPTRTGAPPPAATEVVPLVKVRPAFPSAARSMRASGTVELTLRVREDGTVEDARTVSCTRPGVGFEAAAQAAARRFRYAEVPAGTGIRSVHVQVAFGAAEAGP
jgi:TonB family protein